MSLSSSDTHNETQYDDLMDTPIFEDMRLASHSQLGWGKASSQDSIGSFSQDTQRTPTRTPEKTFRSPYETPEKPKWQQFEDYMVANAETQPGTPFLFLDTDISFVDKVTPETQLVDPIQNSITSFLDKVNAEQELLDPIQNSITSLQDNVSAEKQSRESIEKNNVTSFVETREKPKWETFADFTSANAQKQLGDPMQDSVTYIMDSGNAEKRSRRTSPPSFPGKVNADKHLWNSMRDKHLQALRDTESVNSAKQSGDYTTEHVSSFASNQEASSPTQFWRLPQESHQEALATFRKKQSEQFAAEHAQRERSRQRRQARLRQERHEKARLHVQGWLPKKPALLHVPFPFPFGDL